MLRGMSGGERKRLAIACGVVAGPSLVFLDEPTSGLDSFAALNVVLFLKSMATEHGATLLASLHQPRAAIWSQMDQVGVVVGFDYKFWFEYEGFDFKFEFEYENEEYEGTCYAKAPRHRAAMCLLAVFRRCRTFSVVPCTLAAHMLASAHCCSLSQHSL